MSDEPTALRYAEARADAERRIADDLPCILDGLIGRAREGDIRAATYLLDCIMGRDAGARAAPADDRALPYTEDDYRDQEYRAGIRRLIGGIGAREGA